MKEQKKFYKAIFRNPSEIYRIYFRSVFFNTILVHNQFNFDQ